MIRRPPRSTLSSSSAASDVYKRQDHQYHGDNRCDHGRHVALFNGDRHVGPDAGQPEIPVAQLECFGDHEEEPSTSHAHHTVPDEADSAVGHLDLSETLPPVEVVDGTGLLELLWYGLERIVETERHVPCLSRKDHEYCSKFQSSVAAGKDRYQCQHDAWHEPQDGDALQDVQNGDKQSLGQLVLGRPVSIHNSEEEGDAVSSQSSDQ